jgi:chromosome segregation ATPase
MNSKAQAEIEKLVSLRIPYLGEAEFALALLRAAERNENAIVEWLENWRKPFAEGRTVGLNGSVGATKEQWQAISRDSNKAAQNELLQDSPELKALKALEETARKAREVAEAKDRELTALWSELNGLPAHIEKATNELESISKSLAELDANKARDEYKRLFRAIIDGANADRFAVAFAATDLVTVELRREVLSEKSAELEERLAGLRKRQTALNRKLLGTR